MRLTLPFKVIGIVGAVMIAYAAGNYTLQRHFVLREFTKLEAEGAKRDDDRIDEAFAREQESVGTMASDWGNWNEIHEYMESRNPAIPERDLSVSAMDGLGVDYVALVDAEGQFVWSRSLHPDTRAVIAPPPVASTVLVTWKAAMRAGEKRSGIIRTDLGRDDGGGGARAERRRRGPDAWLADPGSLRHATRWFRNSSQRTKLDFTLTPLQQGSAMPAGSPAPRRETPDYLELTHSFNDISGAPLLQQTVRVPRDLLARGKDTVKLAAVSILLAALVSLLVLIALLRKLVLRPLIAPVGTRAARRQHR